MSDDQLKDIGLRRDQINLKRAVFKTTFFIIPVIARRRRDTFTKFIN